MRYHCEYHENVRAVHLSLRLPSAPDALTSLEAYDRKTLRLRHAFRTYSIPLPGSIDIKKPLKLVCDGHQITCRVDASPIKESSGINEVPFSTTKQLSRDLQCARCRCSLLEGTGISWRLMPSENWAEMMDSWHCHRGVTDEHHNEHHDQYALPDHIVSAAERIRARPGIGLIGLSYLLIHISDATNILVSQF